MNKNTFYITTPIYYTNGIPHIGHAYTSIICDVIAKYQKINGKKVKFATGVDENSQKALLKAQELGMEIMPYLDIMSEKHKAVWDGLDIQYTDYIRTTEERHHKFVKEVLKKTFDNGDIYQGVYEGMYCVGCEAFKKDEDLILKDGKKVCPDHLTEPKILKEKNYFFRLSKYSEKLKDFYKKNPSFVMPQEKFNEVIAFVERGLEDFSISRETNKFGIKLPFDETQVTYVWYDALLNYLTVCDNSDAGKKEFEFWPADLHIVGKEINRFHSIYWLAMLMSAGYELPKNILVNGFVTNEGQKISKSLGNVIEPVEFCEKYSKDLLILYILSNFNIGQDCDFSEKQAVLTYNSKLANNLGNLLNRVVVLSLKLGGNLEIKKIDYLEKDYLAKIFNNFGEYNLKGVLDNSFEFLDKLNLLATQKEPWIMIKDLTKQEEVREILYTIAEGLRKVGLALYPFFPQKMGEMFNKLGLENYAEQLENGKLQDLINKTETFFIKEKGEPLFQKFDV